jgi:hypothetical protein
VFRLSSFAFGKSDHLTRFIARHYQYSKQC